jgi:purine-nucleoside phosphorylase
LRVQAKLEKAVARVRKASRLRPQVGIVLGSGFQKVISRLRIAGEVPFTELAGFPTVSVNGHAGELVLGELGPLPVAVLSGRAHYYEGHSMEQLAFPIRTLAEFGIRDLLLTNAAGAINPRFRRGDFMLLTDHINFMPANPLRGEAGGGHLRFVDMTRTYEAGLNKLMAQAAKQIGLRLHKGVYVAVPGPCYETPAEIRAFARLGADAIGMSTVPEAIVARQCGLGVAGHTCLTNLAAGLSRGALSHAEVLATGKRVEEKGADLITRFAELYAQTH